MRPALIALRNLIGSLRRPGQSSGLEHELAAAIETIAELLADETFGIETGDLRARIAAVLQQTGAQLCPSCRGSELAIDTVYVMMKPFPSDAALAPGQQPCAWVVCKRCGAIRLFDLEVLGVW